MLTIWSLLMAGLLCLSTPCFALRFSLGEQITTIYDGTDLSVGGAGTFGGEVHLSGDSVAVSFGLVKDGTISHDGSALNIIANAEVETDDLMISADTIIIQTDLNSGGSNAGLDLCIGADNTLCICNECV